MAVKMMVALRASLPEIQLTMIGPDKDDGSLTETRKWVEQSGLENAITIISGIPKNQVPSYLSQADIFINTTNIDNTPISVMEAMACGLCVVSTNVGGISYLLEDRKDALLVLPDDWQGMADAIKLLYSQSGLASLLAQNARNKVGQFDWSVVFPQWENLFLELSNRGTN
jgi:glycosyltransferase involved in cell wall biosynthesis